jgi:hypothetical protein
MATTRAGRSPAPYEARPGRGVLVADSLSVLHGPAAGTIELPLWLFWQQERSFDLDNPVMLRWMYEIVLREASQAADLTDHLDGDTLVAVWPQLVLPRGVRRAWEDHHPVLRQAAAAA